MKEQNSRSCFCVVSCLHEFCVPVDINPDRLLLLLGLSEHSPLCISRTPFTAAVVPPLELQFLYEQVQWYMMPSGSTQVILFSLFHSFIHSGYLYSAPSRNLLRGALSPATVKEKCLLICVSLNPVYRAKSTASYTKRCNRPIYRAYRPLKMHHDIILFISVTEYLYTAPVPYLVRGAY